MGKFAGRIEAGICYTALILMALLPLADALLRPFNISIPYSRQFLTRLFLVAGFTAAMLTTRSKEHLSIVLIQFVKNEKIKNNISCITGLISAFLATLLFWNSISFIQFSLIGRTGGFNPDWVFALIMPICYGVMALRFAFYSVPVQEENKKKYLFFALPVIAILAGTFAALPAVVKIIWGVEGELTFNPPVFLFDMVNRLYDFTLAAKAPLIIFFIVAAFSGTPIFAAIGGIALVMLQAAGHEPDSAPIRIFAALTNTDLIAIPLFTITGFFLSESKAGERLVAAFRSFLGWLPGGMIIATVIICAFFTSFTGASGITIMALGGILYIILEKLGYREKFSIGLLTAVGSVGLLFPPSLPIILVGSTIISILFFMGEIVTFRIIDFFLAGIIPGIILVLSRIVYGMIASRKVKIPIEPFNAKEAGTAIKGSAAEILLPVILITGFFTGILSLVEVSALSVVYVFVVQVLIYRDIALKDVFKVFAKAVPIIGGILAILAVANALSYAIIDTQVPEYFAAWMQNTVESRFMFLLLLNLALLVLGFFMDIFSAIMVALPLIVPLAHAYGVDPIHLGIIFIVNLEMGFLTPPVGLNLFMASYRFKKPFMEVCRYILPFLAIQFAVVILITYIPALSLFLVRLFG